MTANPAGYLTHLETALTAIANGKAQLERPPKMIFDDGPGKGDFRVMPCVFRQGASVIKTVKVVGTNVTSRVVPDQVTVGKALALHPEDNFVTHIFDACALSSARTGACVAVAAKRLASKRERIRIVGSGRVALYAALYLHALGGVKGICFQDPVPGRASALAAWARERLAGTAASAGTTADPASEDILVLATTATAPICRPQDTGANLIISVGADTDDQRELDSSWATAAAIYVDVMDSFGVGDLRAWRKEGVISEGQVVELLQLLRDGNGDPPPDKRRAFISTGSAIFDNLTIKYLLDQGLA
ncbi:MAG: hypothetical protein HZA91_12415 [Verrucomicrobia bacterium]|nr:hypothetical protein [Verrucomicrobiota bacterium]